MSVISRLLKIVMCVAYLMTVSNLKPLVIYVDIFFLFTTQVLS